MKRLFLLLNFIFFVWQSYGQSRNCPMSIDLNIMQTQNPARYQRFMNLETFTNDYINNQGGANYRLADPNGLIIIPVVVHVLHRNEAVGTGFNISLAQIQSQIDVLNEDFRRLNTDRVNTPAAFAGISSDYNFEFRLACQDPNGNPTNGVLRRFTNKATFPIIQNSDGTVNETSMGIKMTSLSGEDPWPTDRYLNIWVCNLTDILGYATFPADFATNPNVDGVVIATTAMGRVGNVTAPFDRGRTATHEIGHWLNLRHVSGDAFCGNDFVADTPIQQTQNSGCPVFPHRTCGNTTNGDMFMNYMDFTDDPCMNAFSNGQRLRGRAIFAAGGPRAIFLDNYFRIQQPSSTIICSGAITLTNPNCLAPTWSIVSGPASITSVGNNQVTIQANATGTVTLSAIAGNYFAEAIINVSYSGPPADYSTLIYPNGQRGVDPVSLCTGCTYMFNVDFVQGATSYTWRIPRGFTISGQGTSNPYITTSSTPGSYTFYCSANNACGSSWTRDLHINLESGGGGGIQQIAVYPNPATNSLTIESTQSDLTISENPTKNGSQLTANETFTAKLFDQFTLELLSGTSENGRIIFDVRNIQKGIYYLHVIKNEKEVIVRQILIDK